MKRILSICVLVFFLLSLTIPALAEPEETYLAYLEDEQDLTVIVTFDKAFPQVWLIDPEGNRLEAVQGSTDMDVAVNDTWAAIRVKTPANGDWRIAIEKGENTQVNHYMVTATENIWIQYIHVTPNEDGTVEVKFLAERGEWESGYDYTLSLGTETGGGVELRTGWAVTGQEETVTLNLEKYNSYDKYVMYLYVEMHADGKTLFDEYASQPFAFVNPNKLEAPKGVDIQVDNQLRQVIVNWSEYKEYSFDSYYLEIYAEGEQELLYYGDFQREDDRFSTYIPAEKDQITVRFYGRDGKLLSEPVERKVLLGDKSYLQLLTESPTGSNQAQIRMELPKDTVMKVTVGETLSEFVSDGKENTVAVNIANGNNDLSAEAVVDGVTYRLEKQIYKDGFPPMLSFYEPYDGKRFADTQVRILGNAEDAKKLYLNDQEITLGENGDFDTTVTLQPGENVAEFVAEDAVGNRTARTLYLMGPESQSVLVLSDGTTVSVKQFIPLFVALGLSIAAIVVILIMNKRRESLKKFSWTALIIACIVLAVAAAAMLVMTVVRMNQLEGIVSSMELSHIADEDLQKAADLVTELEAAPKKILVWGCITGGLVMITVALVIIKNRIMKGKKPATEEAPEEIVQEEQPQPPQEESEE